MDDLQRWFAAGALGVVAVLAIILAVSRRKNPGPDQRLSLWRSVPATLWALAVLAAGVITRLDPDFHLCKTTTVRTPKSLAVETSQSDNGKTLSTRRTVSGGATEVTKTCEPLGLGELALLFLPSIFLIAPVIKSANLGGVLGLEVRDLARKEAAEQATRVVVEINNLSAKTEVALRELEEGKLEDLTPGLGSERSK